MDENEATCVHLEVHHRQSRLKTIVGSEQHNPKRRLFPVNPLHTTRRRSRDPPSSDLIQLHRGQLYTRSLHRNFRTRHASCREERDPPRGQKENEIKEWRRDLRLRERGYSFFSLLQMPTGLCLNHDHYFERGVDGI